MNLGLISLICLLAAIVIGFVKNCNVGILCTGIAAVLALVFGIKASDIIKGLVHPCASRWSVLLICLQLLTETEPWNF